MLTWTRFYITVLIYGILVLLLGSHRILSIVKNLQNEK
jgi:hypothetical protein